MRQPRPIHVIFVQYVHDASCSIICQVEAVPDTAMLPSDRSSDGSILTWTQNKCKDLNGYDQSDDFMRFPAVDITAELWYDGSGGLRRWYMIACPVGEIETVYNRCTGSRHRREIGSPPGLPGEII